MDTKKLRQKVLDLAIHGKLVKQDPNDEPASILLDRIRAEKARLVKEGKIKKSDLTEKPISEDEIPFEVPEGWEWTRFGTIANCILGKMLDKAKNDGEIKPYLRNINIRWGSVDFSDILSMPFSKDEEKKLTLVENDLLICEGGEPGRCAVWKKEYPSILFQKALHRARFYLNINPYFVASILKLYANTDKLSPYITGSTIKHLPGVGLSLVPIPLPPLAEQHRIVKAVDELFEQIDIIERSEKELEEAASKTRDKLLNLAIQGHLVPQDPNEEPASVLLERIRAEKARLVKEGKLKKKDLEEKPISPDEIPFDIPEGWVWCRFNSLVNFEMGATPERRNDDYWVSGNHPWISISDMKDLQTIDNSKERITDAALQKYFGNRCSPKGTLIMSFKLTIGRVSILGMDATHNEAIISIYPYVDKDNSLRDYLLHFLRLLTSYIQTTNAIKGSTLNSSKMSQMLIPLPPLSEQRRIVTKLEEILPRLKSMNGMTDR